MLVLNTRSHHCVQVRINMQLMPARQNNFVVNALSTRFVRENCGTGLRDGEDAVLELPSSWSKRTIYKRFCDERGWEVQTTARGTTETKPKPQEENKPICHWRSFQRFWQKEYPLLRLPKPAADICTDCHILVLRLALFLVEAKYFEKVSFMFYILGHTKNAADCWFNQLKKTYRRSNLFTFKQLVESMKTHDRITVREVKDGDFKDYDAFLNFFYKKLASGTVSKNHIFSVEGSQPTMLSLKADNIAGTITTTQALAKSGVVNRLDGLCSRALEAIADPGIPEIKQVELFTKYRRLIPLAFQDITCPDPGEDIMARIKSTRNAKARK